MSHKEQITLYLDVQGTVHACVDLVDICETEADGTTISLPYKLGTDWRTIIAQCVIDDILFDHHDLASITDLLLVQDKFRIFRRDDNGENDNCNKQSAFKRLLTSTIASNKTFRIIIHLYVSAMTALALHPRENTASPNVLRYPAPIVPSCHGS
jgi:hypothetical protein